MVAFNVVEAKKLFSELLGRVAYGGERILITRRGKPMAELVPPRDAEEVPHLADVKGWLENDDPFFTRLDELRERRSRRVPRVLQDEP